MKRHDVSGGQNREDLSTWISAIWQSVLRFVAPVSLIGALILLWQIIVVVFGMDDYILPSPWQVLQAGFEARGLLWEHMVQTALETLLGFGLALTVGLGLGVLIAVSPGLHDALYPVLVISQTIPTVAIAPLLAIWFGYGIWPKIIVVGLVCFFPIAVNTADGLLSADPELVALLRTMGADKRQIFRAVSLPGAMPMVFSGIKIAITYSVVGAILGEWVGASRGLGIFMLRASNSFRTDWVFASIGITALLSIVLFVVVHVLERVSLPWYYTQTRREQWEELDS